jgi:AMP deaminase
LAALNHLRASKGLNCFEFRPHSGEAGDVDHLTSCFLVANKINHGIQLRKAPGLHYLYYLCQIGLAMSPLSNNKLFLDYNKNPFKKYFAQGLNVSLSTDDPLLLHVTKEPLMEEYSVAAQVWKLSSVDQCEIARNSVLQSGLEYRFKRHYLGKGFQLPGAQGNDIRQTNVPSLRLQYRSEQLMEEMEMIRNGVKEFKK